TVGSFFFSSRRRHTRLQGDWSSDVCSSDLSRCPATRLVWPSTDERPIPSTILLIEPQRVSAAAASSCNVAKDIPLVSAGKSRPRSEERRVGKECKARGAP